MNWPTVLSSFAHWRGVKFRGDQTVGRASTRLGGAAVTTKRRPVRHRERLTYPPPWEDRPVSRELWEKFRDRLMAACGPGRRPEEWWLYELGREPPENETQMLYTMGALRSDELHRLMKWWRSHYDEANEVITSPSHGIIRKSPQERREYLDHHCVPPELVKQWDSEAA